MSISKYNLNDQILQNFYKEGYKKVENLDPQLILKINAIFESIEVLKNTLPQNQVQLLEHKIKPELSKLLNELSQKIDNFYKQTLQTIVDPMVNAHTMLENLQTRLENIQLEKIAISTFSDEIKIPKEQRTAFENFLLKILRNVLNKLETKIFGGYQVNLKQKSHIQKMNDLVAQLKKTGFNDSNQKELIKWIQEKEETDKTLQEKKQEYRKVKNSAAEKKLIMEKQEFINEKIKKLSEDQNKLNKDPRANQYASLTKNQKNIFDKISKFSLKLDKMIQNEEKGEKTRQNMLLIGGEQVLIHDKTSQSDLDGMYLSADKFRQSLKESDTQIATYKHGEKLITGFLFQKTVSSSTPSFLEALKELGIDEANWKLIETKQGFFLIPGEDYTILNNDKVNFNNLALTPQQIKLDQKSKGGTIILTSGNKGVYEMHKKEMLVYLLKGMNVMAFNFSGYGKSTGVPGDKALKSNMKAAYQHLIKHHPHLTSDKKIDNSKIMLKAMCMSGGPATYLASQEECKGMHLFLDQSYADFRDLIKDQIKGKIGKKYPRFAQLLGTHHINSLSNLIAKLIAPDWKIKEDIKHVAGTITFLSTGNDTLIPANQGVNQNIDSLKSVNKYDNNKIKSYIMPGTHGISLINVKEQLVVLKKNSNPKNVILKIIVARFKQKSNQGVVTKTELNSIIKEELMVLFDNNQMQQRLKKQAESLFDFSNIEYLPGMKAINEATQNAGITGSIFPEKLKAQVI